MALSILDGNQTATTLSTILTSGAHIPAHTVVSLGTQAKSDITSAISGSVVSISNFPGTVTVGNSVTIGNFPAVQDVAINGNPAVYLIDDEQNPLGFGQNPVLVSVNGTASVAIKDPSNLSITSTAAAGSKRGIDANLITSVTIGSLPAISGTVTVGNSVTIGSLPRVTLIDGSGSVATANSAIQVFATTTTRSYLLVQVTTGSAYVNVGATATTTNGIYLASGQGYAWETTIPQGICSLISTVTGTAYCAKQA